MGDPRLDGRHLNVARRDQYEAAVDDVLDDRGPLTAAADPLARPPATPQVRARREQPPPGGEYRLLSAADGSRIPLRVGITAIGRADENDILIPAHFISRRHCVAVVHATGGCEVTDTASRNGTRVNGRRVGRAVLLPGDVLDLCGFQFLVVWVGPGGGAWPATSPPDTMELGQAPPTTQS
jgi:pSer/pThr/pTyr-binding forkhead associated (FHA) protein